MGSGPLARLTSIPAARISAAAGILVLAFFLAGYDRSDFALPDNPVFLDRHGRILRFVPDENGERRIETPLAEIPTLVRNAFIAAEDERFYAHHGIDVKGIVRAARDNAREGRIVSGGSTITMQLSRMAYPRERTYTGKLAEAFRSIRIEAGLSKDEILEEYLNRVPMGGNMRGVGIASTVYFGKRPSELLPAEAAVLASLPKAPSALYPYGRNSERLLQRRDWTLKRMFELGYIRQDEYEKAVEFPPYFPPEKSVFYAPHLVERLLALRRAEGPSAPSGWIATTIDLDIQREVEGALRSHKERLRWKGASQSAAIVIHNRTMEVLAYAGSIEYSSESLGFNDGVSAPRSAGSTLKPFVYAMALDAGRPTSAVLPDTSRKYRAPKGDFSPVNFDRRQYGPVTMRAALGNSLNLSAIKMLEAVGQENFYELLVNLGLIDGAEDEAQRYGLGLVIGNPEVRLDRLSEAYAMLANKGVRRPLRFTVGEPAPQGEPVVSEEAAFIISDILSDPSARSIAFGNPSAFALPFRVSMKTGTSTKYRDAWAVGYTPDYTVGVWVGNFDGSPTFGLSGASGAVPIFSDIIKTLYGRSSPPEMEIPKGVARAKVCGISGMKPGRNCRYLIDEYFVSGSEPADECAYHKKAGEFHDLPAEYAMWLSAKKSSGSAGGYRLSGYEGNAMNAARLPSDGFPAIRSRSLKPSEASGPRTLQQSEAVSGHMRIGENSVVDEMRYREESLGGVTITYPLAGDRFVLRRASAPGEPRESVIFEAVPEETAGYIEWYVDGSLYAKAGPPYSVYWNPSAGKHMIIAMTPSGMADAITITVE